MNESTILRAQNNIETTLHRSNNSLPFDLILVEGDALLVVAPVVVAMLCVFLRSRFFFGYKFFMCD
jgi:hypothetical protein